MTFLYEKFKVAMIAGKKTIPVKRVGIVKMII